METENLVHMIITLDQNDRMFLPIISVKSSSHILVLGSNSVISVSSHEFALSFRALQRLCNWSDFFFFARKNMNIIRRKHPPMRVEQQNIRLLLPCHIEYLHLHLSQIRAPSKKPDTVCRQLFANAIELNWIEFYKILQHCHTQLNYHTICISCAVN